MLGLDSHLHRRGSHNVACVLLGTDGRVICSTRDSDLFRTRLACVNCFYTIPSCCEKVVGPCLLFQSGVALCVPHATPRSKINQRRRVWLNHKLKSNEPTECPSIASLSCAIKGSLLDSQECAPKGIGTQRVDWSKDRLMCTCTRCAMLASRKSLCVRRTPTHSDSAVLRVKREKAQKPCYAAQVDMDELKPCSCGPMTSLNGICRNLMSNQRGGREKRRCRTCRRFFGGPFELEDQHDDCEVYRGTENVAIKYAELDGKNGTYDPTRVRRKDRIVSSTICKWSLEDVDRRMSVSCVGSNRRCTTRLT